MLLSCSLCSWIHAACTALFPVPDYFECWAVARFIQRAFTSEITRFQARMFLFFKVERRSMKGLILNKWVKGVLGSAVVRMIPGLITCLGSQVHCWINCYSTWYDTVNYVIQHSSRQCHPRSMKNLHFVHSKQLQIGNTDVRSNTIFVLTKEFVSKATRMEEKKAHKIWIYLHLHVIWFMMWDDGFELDGTNIHPTRINGINWQVAKKDDDKEQQASCFVLALISEKTISVSRSLKRIVLAMSEIKKYNMTWKYLTRT